MDALMDWLFVGMMAAIVVMMWLGIIAAVLALLDHYGWLTWR